MRILFLSNSDFVVAVAHRRYFQWIQHPAIPGAWWVEPGWPGIMDSGAILTECEPRFEACW